MKLREHIDKVESICEMIERGDTYTEELVRYFGEINNILSAILTCAQDENNDFVINDQFILQVLKDILYGEEHKDSVFLLDTLRYGLLEIYKYTLEKYKMGEINE